jgi:hypothetical protein
MSPGKGRCKYQDDQVCSSPLAGMMTLTLGLVQQVSAGLASGGWWDWSSEILPWMHLQ